MSDDELQQRVAGALNEAMESGWDEAMNGARAALAAIAEAAGLDAHGWDYVLSQDIGAYAPRLADILRALAAAGATPRD